MALRRDRIIKIQFLNVKWLLIFGLAYLWSFFLLHNYVGGDQEHYKEFYSAAGSTTLLGAFLTARQYLSAFEPFTISILWLGSALGIPKDLYISFFNSVFLVSLLLLFRKYRVGIFVAILLISNYYVIVLLTGAERLKFAYILLVFSGLLKGWFRYLYFSLAPFAHLQSLLFFPSVFFASYYFEIRKLLIKMVVKKSSLILFAIFGLSLLFILPYFWSALIEKGSAYFALDRSLLVFINLAFLSFVALLATRNWKRMFLVLIVHYPMVLFLGGDRVNMVAVTVVIWLLMVEQRLRHPLVIVLLSYFSVKSFGFVYRIMVYGDGFA